MTASQKHEHIKGILSDGNASYSLLQVFVCERRLMTKKKGRKKRLVQKYVIQIHLLHPEIMRQSSLGVLSVRILLNCMIG